jgi:hypothetical protein
MMLLRLAMLALLALPSAGTAQSGSPDIVVQGDVARREIERILGADNLDTSRLGPSEVAEAIAGIERGRAPEDFWLAYRAHVRAWERLAAAAEQARPGLGESLFESEELVKAEQAIDATFDEVERIARVYGARLPTPLWSIPPTV